MRILLVLLLLCLALPARAMDTIAREALVIDLSTGAVLLDKDAGKRMPPSSMTKIMTLYLTFEALKSGRLTLESTLPVSANARKQPGSRMFLEQNSRPTVEDLVRGTAIQSGNDAAVTLAEGLAGSEADFAAMMNRKAAAMGLEDSHFVNATGLPDPGHYMTAHDLATLATALIHDFPEYYRYEAERTFTYNGIDQANRNPLLGRVEGADGMKTGHTAIAGYGLVGTAMRDGRRILLVLNGLDSESARASESERLLNWAFSATSVVTLLKPGVELDRLAVWRGTAPDVGVTVKDTLRLTLAPEARAGVTARLKAAVPLTAPVAQGQEVGTLIVTVPGQGERSLPAYATAAVPKLGLIGRSNAGLRELVSP